LAVFSEMGYNGEIAQQSIGEDIEEKLHWGISE
jgi:hypothetical protein